MSSTSTCELYTLVYTPFTQVVALNALIALMGSTYERVVEKRVSER
jgi:hypothetical protein